MTTPVSSAESGELVALGNLNDLIFRSASLFARMIAIASLRSESTGRYENVDVGFRVPAVHQVLLNLHVEIFAHWLLLPLRMQKADINIHIDSLGASERAVEIRQLLELGERMIPQSAIPVERRLFLQDLRIIQALLGHDV